MPFSEIAQYKIVRGDVAINHLEGKQKVLFIFWLLCVSMFVISLILLVFFYVVEIIRFVVVKD